jgi:Fur family iron response transcriptional regulator
MHDKYDLEPNLPGLLRAHGINPTRQRIAIARALFRTPGHHCADDVGALVNKERAQTSKATVYNTLNLFVKQGLVREVIVEPQKVFYDANISEHYHYYDISTGQLSDIDAEGISIKGLPATPEGVVTEGIDLVVRVRSTLPRE